MAHLPVIHFTDADAKRVRISKQSIREIIVKLKELVFVQRSYLCLTCKRKFAPLTVNYAGSDCVIGRILYFHSTECNSNMTFKETEIRVLLEDDTI